MRYSVVAEGVDDVEAVGDVDAEAVGVAKLLVLLVFTARLMTFDYVMTPIS